MISKSCRSNSWLNRHGSVEDEQSCPSPQENVPEAGIFVDSPFDGQDCPSSTHPAVDGQVAKVGFDAGKEHAHRRRDVGGADRSALREAFFASVARAIINPAGDAWY